MPAKNQAQILSFYEDFRTRGGWEILEAVREFLPRLFRERDLAGCTLFTSHAVLCIVRYPTYDQWCDKPLLSINCTARDRLQFDFRITLSPSPVYRYVTESVNCPVEQGLEEFDRLYTKFLAAHESLPQPT